MKKTFVLTVSKQFPKSHNQAGKSTGFVENITKLFTNGSNKIHTIRSNYEFWERRAKEINEGKAVLSIRYWSGKPYRSQQVEICSLESVGIEKLTDPTNFVFASINGKEVDWNIVAKNDGLSFDDFCEWFNIRQKEPMVIIHFTNFRYANKQQKILCSDCVYRYVDNLEYPCIDCVDENKKQSGAEVNKC